MKTLKHITIIVSLLAIVFLPFILTLIFDNGWWLMLYPIGVLISIGSLLFSTATEIAIVDNNKSTLREFINHYPNDDDLGRIIREFYG